MRRMVWMPLAAVFVACGGAVDSYGPLRAGDAAPAYGARTLDGDSITLAGLQGRTLLLNVWATWCPPCREEMPALQALDDRYRERGLEVVAVSIDQNAQEAAVFADELGLRLRVLHDPAARVTRTFRTTGVPETFLIDRNGRIVRRWIGAFDPLAADVTADVEAALAEDVTGVDS